MNIGLKITHLKKFALSGVIFFFNGAKVKDWKRKKSIG